MATEHTFTDLVVDLPGRRPFRVRGAIDRVDRDRDGSLVVLDYKTGGTRAYDRLSEADPHQRGTMLQLYLYAKAARADFPPVDAEGPAAPVRAHYWFTSLKGDFKAKGYELTPDVEAEIESALTLVVEGIEGGVFPARPADDPAFAWVDCWYCTPDGLSDTERRRDWGRKRLDPALSGFLALAEPETTDDE